MKYIPTARLIVIILPFSSSFQPFHPPFVKFVTKEKSTEKCHTQNHRAFDQSFVFHFFFFFSLSSSYTFFTIVLFQYFWSFYIYSNFPNFQILFKKQESRWGLFTKCSARKFKMLFHSCMNDCHTERLRDIGDRLYGNLRNWM